MTLEETLRESPEGTRCIVCPVCNGGPQRERTFSVTREGMVVKYICHRMKCPTAGYRAFGFDERDASRAYAPAFKPRELTADFRLPEKGEYWYGNVALRLPPGDDTVETFARRFGFRVLTDTPTTCVWELRNVFAARPFGYQTRTENKHVRTWIHEDAPKYAAFGAFDPKTPVLLVEDCMSAALAALQGWPAIALLGTHLSRDVALALTSALPEAHFVVALDPDAKGPPSDAMMDRLRALGANARKVMLPCDIKDLSPTYRGQILTGMLTARV